MWGDTVCSWCARVHAVHGHCQYAAHLKAEPEQRTRAGLHHRAVLPPSCHYCGRPKLQDGRCPACSPCTACLRPMRECTCPKYVAPAASISNEALAALDHSGPGDAVLVSATTGRLIMVEDAPWFDLVWARAEHVAGMISEDV